MNYIKLGKQINPNKTSTSDLEMDFLMLVVVVVCFADVEVGSHRLILVKMNDEGPRPT